MFLGSLWFVGWLILRMPHDFFITHDSVRLVSNPALHYVVLIVKNLLGVVLLILGVMMLVLPGQGIITVILGLSLMNFPGKQRLLRWILSRQSVRKSMNWIRRKAHRPPLVFE